MYHASGRPTLRTGSIISPPPRVRASEPFGKRISATPYGREDANGWSPRLLRDVESRYSAKATARAKRRTASKSNTRSEIAASERRTAGTIRMADVD